MLKKRINKDYFIRWPVTVNNEVTSLVGMDLKLVLRDPKFRNYELIFKSQGNVVIAEFPITLQEVVGVYHLTLWMNWGKPGQSAVDASNFVELVKDTSLEDDNADTIDVDSGNIEIGIQGRQGNNGATFIPSISEDGICSWTNDQGLENPKPVKIKGGKGDPGVSVTHSWEGTELILTSSSGTTRTDLKGKQGDRGFPGTVNWPRFQTDPATGHLMGSADNPESCKTLEIREDGHLVHWS